MNRRLMAAESQMTGLSSFLDSSTLFSSSSVFLSPSGSSAPRCLPQTTFCLRFLSLKFGPYGKETLGTVSLSTSV